MNYGILTGLWNLAEIAPHIFKSHNWNGCLFTISSRLNNWIVIDIQVRLQISQTVKTQNCAKPTKTPSLIQCHVIHWTSKSVLKLQNSISIFDVKNEVNFNIPFILDFEILCAELSRLDQV